jgi:hypothetical protein
MEILIVVAIMAVVTKRGVEDILHTARGGTPHRYTAAKQRKASGAAGRYWSTLWEDTWTDMAAKHAERRDQRRSGASPAPMSRAAKPRGAATQFFAGLAQDGRRAARRSWEDGWTRLDEKRRTKATRPRPGQVTVPGTVVPNAQDEGQDEEVRPHQDRPQDEAGFMCLSCGTRPALPRSLWCSSCGPRPQDEDRPDPAQDERTDLQFGDDPTDPTGTKTCPECHGTSITQDGICLACRDRQEQRNQRHDNQTNSPLASTTTQEGTTTMTTTIPTGEVAGLSDAIRFSDASAQAFRAQAIATEQTVAALAAGGVTGPAAASFAAAMEKSEAAAMDMDAATAELKSHLAVQEAYNANKGAGTREFVTAGQ